MEETISFEMDNFFAVVHIKNKVLLVLKIRYVSRLSLVQQYYFTICSSDKYALLCRLRAFEGFKKKSTRSLSNKRTRTLNRDLHHVQKEKIHYHRKRAQISFYIHNKANFN